MVHHGPESSEFLMMALAPWGSCSSMTSHLQKTAARQHQWGKWVEGGAGQVLGVERVLKRVVNWGFWLAQVCVCLHSALRPLAPQSQSG